MGSLLSKKLDCFLHTKLIFCVKYTILNTRDKIIIYNIFKFKSGFNLLFSIGVELGENEVRNWLISLIITILTGIFVIQPLQVITKELKNCFAF